MKRRSFLAALAPIMALAAPAGAQTPAPAAASEAAAKAKPAVPATSGTTATVPGAAPAGAPADKSKRAKGPTEITAMEAMLDNKANLAVFSGEVDVKAPDYTINCDKLTVYLKKSKPGPQDVKVPEPKPIGAEDVADKDAAGKGGNKPADKPDDNGSSIDTAIAEGNVKIVQIKPPEGNNPPQKYFGVGKKAVFDNQKQSCTLTGWPRVQQSIGGNLSKEIVSLEEGCVIVMNNDRIDVRGGRHMTRIIDESALEGDNGKGKNDKGGTGTGTGAGAKPGAGGPPPVGGNASPAGGASFRGNPGLDGSSVR